MATHDRKIVGEFRVVQVKFMNEKFAVLHAVCLEIAGHHVVYHDDDSSMRKQSNNKLLMVGEKFFISVKNQKNNLEKIRQTISNKLGIDEESTEMDQTTKKKNVGKWIDLGKFKDERLDDIAIIMSSKAIKTLDRNRRGTILLDCDEILRIGNLETIETIRLRDFDEIEENKMLPETNTKSIEQFTLYDKIERHRLFAEWLVSSYGLSFLSSGSGVLDVAGGNGELALALLRLGVKSVTLLDPKPRFTYDVEKEPMYASRLTILEHELNGDGGELLETTITNDLEKQLIADCSIIVGMHPDQATEPIVELSFRLRVPFAILPCCVMPKMFPHRRQKRHGDPVRSYRSFCQYLIDMAPPGISFEEHHLPFLGRNTIIFVPLKLNI